MTVLTTPPADGGTSGSVPAILRCAAEMGEALDQVSDAQPVFLETDAKAAALELLVAVESRVHELRLRVMAAAGDVVAVDGTHDIASWLASTAHVRLRDARADQRLATALDQRYPTVAAGLRDGRVNPAQAHVITSTLDALVEHADVPDDVLARAEAELVDHAAHFNPKQLARLARRILDVIAPEIAEEADARRLAALETDARRRTRLSLRRQGDGTTRVSGLIPDLAATRLATYLEAFTNPRVSPGAGTDEHTGISADPVSRLSYPWKVGDAFVSFLEAVDPKRLPVHGGDAATLTVTMSLESLRRELGTADLLGTAAIGGADGEDRITAAEARRLACNAFIIPAVLGADSEILDLGRASRLFSRAQRRALLLRDKTCRAVGCDRPGAWTEAHHLDPWSRGGPTDLSNAVLLCSTDHHRAHDPDYLTERLPNGDIRFHRRT